MSMRASQRPIAVATIAARRVGAAIVDTVYPKRCAGCRRRGAWVCADCLDQVAVFAGSLCPGCGIPLALSRCSCDHLAPGLVAVRSLGPFGGWLRQAVLNFKYHDEWARAGHLGDALAPVVAAMGDAAGLLPVPLHRSRLRERGYNQSALLATVVGERLGLPVVDAMLRTRPTAQQALLSGLERVRNVDGAFALVPGFDPAGLDLVLVDDVITTGSTINACARMLVDHGAASVRAATLARQL